MKIRILNLKEKMLMLLSLILTENEQGVLSVLKEGIKLRPEIQKSLGFSQTTAIVTIAALIDKGFIVEVGNGNETKYKISVIERIGR